MKGRWFRVVLGTAGLALVSVSLIILRYFMLATMDAGWVVLIILGASAFIVGSRLLLDNVSLLRPYSDMWAVFCLANIFAWLIHAGQIDEVLANSNVGSAFASLTVTNTAGLLKLSGVRVTWEGEMLYFGPPSRLDAVAVTGLCSGFLSFMMFTGAFSLVLFDVGKTLGVKRLLLLLLLGVTGTFFISSLRVYLVLVLGYYFGVVPMETAHLYLGYVLFLVLIVCFWYGTLEWSRRLKMQIPSQKPTI